MEVERVKVVDLINNIQKLQEKIYRYNKSRGHDTQDETFFWLDRISVELRLLYCDARDILLSDALLRQKYIEQKCMYEPTVSATGGSRSATQMSAILD